MRKMGSVDIKLVVHYQRFSFALRVKESTSIDELKQTICDVINRNPSLKHCPIDVRRLMLTINRRRSLPSNRDTSNDNDYSQDQDTEHLSDHEDTLSGNIDLHSSEGITSKMRTRRGKCGDLFADGTHLYAWDMAAFHRNFAVRLDRASQDQYSDTIEENDSYDTTDTDVNNQIQSDQTNDNYDMDLITSSALNLSVLDRQYSESNVQKTDEEYQAQSKVYQELAGRKEMNQLTRQISQLKETVHHLQNQNTKLHNLLRILLQRMGVPNAGQALESTLMNLGLDFHPDTVGEDTKELENIVSLLLYSGTNPQQEQQKQVEVQDQEQQLQQENEQQREEQLQEEERQQYDTEVKEQELHIPQEEVQEKQELRSQDDHIEVVHPGAHEIEVQRKQTLTYIIEEIKLTELNYVTDLEILHELFFQPLQKANILKQNEMDGIFSNVTSIMKGNKLLSNDLMQVPRGVDYNEQIKRLSEIFTKYVAHFKIYGIYCANQDRQIKELKQCENSNKAFVSFLKHVHNNPKCRKLPLESFLATPLQRVCKYPLFFKELAKNSLETDAAFEDLVNMHKLMSNVVEYINNQKKKADNMQTMLQISSMIDQIPDSFPLVVPKRTFIMRASLGKISQGLLQERHFFLFNDVLIYTRESFVFYNTFHYRGRIEAGRAILCDVPDDPQKYRGCNRLQIIRKDSTNTSYVLSFNSLEEKQKWTKALSEYICTPTPQTLFPPWRLSKDAESAIEQVTKGIIQNVEKLVELVSALQQDDNGNWRTFFRSWISSTISDTSSIIKHDPALEEIKARIYTSQNDLTRIVCEFENFPDMVNILHIVDGAIHELINFSETEGVIVDVEKRRKELAIRKDAIIQALYSLEKNQWEIL